MESGYVISSNDVAEEKGLEYAPLGNSGVNTANKCDIVNETVCTELVLPDQAGLDTSDSHGCSSGTAPVSIDMQSGDTLDGKPDDIELGDLFLEESSLDQVLPPEVFEVQKKEKIRELCSEKNLEKMEGIWKKVICSIQEVHNTNNCKPTQFQISLV